MRSYSKTFFLAILLVVLAPFTQVFAERVAPPTIQSLENNGIRYEVPNTVEKMGVVLAYDKQSGKRLWEKKVYRVFINPMVEKDTQWVFIKQIYMEDGKLIVVNEKGKRFELDPVSGKKKQNSDIIVLLVIIGAMALGLLKLRFGTVKNKDD